MKTLYFLLFLFIAGCAIKHEVDPIKVEPIVVNHKIQVSVEALRSFYVPVCTGDLNNDTQLKVDTCVNNKINDFLNALSNSSL